MKKLIVFTFLLSVLVFAKDGNKKFSPSSTLGVPPLTHININNISSWFQNTGSSDINQQNNAGLVYPKGSGKTAAFQSGFLWGARLDNQFEVGGSTYWSGTVPGRILPNGTAANPNATDVRIYRVRRDYKDPNADFSSEINNGEGTTPQIKAQYALDWQNWPAARTNPADPNDPFNQGAPYKDVNGDGKYNPNVDIPGVPGADQTIWFVCNDLNPTAVSSMSGSIPLGIEEQVTIWAYNQTGALGNMFFRKYTIINKNASQKPFTEMYVSMWSDVDIGDASDDYVGCDSTLSMMYFYNGKAVDSVYNPLPPPATGFDFLQGPKVPGAVTDRAIFKGKYVNGFKNLPMTGFYFCISSDAVYADPVGANYNTGTLEWYNLFRSRVSITGQPFTDPNTGKVTMYPLAGDPVTGSGWIDGQLRPPGDRRGGMASGPFTMAYGDTQEVIVSEMCAGATTGVDRFSAIILLKQYDLDAQQAYNDFFNIPTSIENNSNVPTRYSLSQNYPNPFNPTTKIRYDIPKQTHVKLIVYDILGRELEKLVDKEMQSGSYEAIFDGKNLPSGVYFYRITTKEFSQTKKFVLMK
ncbi:MAG: T9SS type A sorting domain-containing protein [Ignavibacteriales bacterium]|nr:T9SS type A sorting domain-containing protein [Ignavibacteriales bacterium]